jgi:threonyl-tRNA synthetase
MLHRAILGSLERFIASTSSTPRATSRSGWRRCRCVVLPIAERHAEWAAAVRALVARGVRAELDARNEKLNFKIREAELAKIPVMLVLGDQEVANGTVTPRRRRGGRGATGAVALDAFVTELTAAVADRRE